MAAVALAIVSGASCSHHPADPEARALIDDDSVLTRPAAAPDTTLAYAPGAEQIADIRFGKGTPERRPLVVLVHGGFWRPAYDRAHVGPMSVRLRAPGGPWRPSSTAEYRERRKPLSRTSAARSKRYLHW